MLFKNEAMSFDGLVDTLQTLPGIMEFCVGVLCVLAGVSIARKVYLTWFADKPERYNRFVPYVAFRLVLPLSTQLLLVASSILSWVLFHHKAHVLWVLSALLLWMAVIRCFSATLRQAMPVGRLERTTEHFVAFFLWLGFASWAIGFDEVVMDWLQSVTFHIGRSRLDLLTILNAILWVSLIVVGALWVSRLIESKVMSLKHVDVSLRIVVSKIARTGLLVVAVLIALPVVGIDLTVLSVFGGALGVGLGFGLQKIASNYVSGFIILLDRSIRLGDRLMVDNRVGYVTKITSRYVVLKGLDGSEALIPNDFMVSNTVINQSYSDKSIWTSVPIQIAYSSDLEFALKLLREAGEHPRILTSPGPYPYVVAFAASGINLELGFWVADPENGLMSLKSDVNLAIWRLFKQNNIDIPFPQQDIRIVDVRTGATEQKEG